MCTTNSPELNEEIMALKAHYLKSGRNVAGTYIKSTSDKFVHDRVGFNYRMTNIQAAIGLAQVENAGMLVEARKGVGLRYNKRLKDVKGLILPIEKEGCKNVYWMYGVVLSDEIKLTREEVMQKLKEKGVDTRSFFNPMHKQPAYVNKTVKNAPDCHGSFPVADKIGERGFYLPSSSDLSDDEIEQARIALKEILEN